MTKPNYVFYYVPLQFGYETTKKQADLIAKSLCDALALKFPLYDFTPCPQNGNNGFESGFDVVMGGELSQHQAIEAENKIYDWIRGNWVDIAGEVFNNIVYPQAIINTETGLAVRFSDQECYHIPVNTELWQIDEKPPTGGIGKAEGDLVCIQHVVGEWELYPSNAIRTCAASFIAYNLDVLWSENRSELLKLLSLWEYAKLETKRDNYFIYNAGSVWWFDCDQADLIPGSFSGILPSLVACFAGIEENISESEINNV